MASDQLHTRLVTNIRGRRTSTTHSLIAHPSLAIGFTTLLVTRSTTMPTSSVPSAEWTVVIPVKQTTAAKTRLSSVEPALRQRLAFAFAGDTISAVLACSSVSSVAVVTNDPSADLFRQLGADVIPDEPDAGLNPALVHAGESIRRRQPGARLVAVVSDLPALTPAALELALRHVSPSGSFVTDAAGVGTTLLAISAHDSWLPSFGQRSRAAHRQQGLDELDVPGLETLHRDVDTEVDLWDAQRLGLGRYTSDVLAGSGGLGLT